MPTLQGKYKVPHFDAKGGADHVFTEPACRRRSSTRRSTGRTSSTSAWARSAARTASCAITLPIGNAKLPGIAAEDIGKAAYGIFKAGDEYIGKTVGIAGEHLSGAEMAAAFTKALGEEVSYNEVSPEIYRGFGFPGADDLGNMFQYKRDFEDHYRGRATSTRSRALNPQLQTFEQWLGENIGRIPIA